MTERKNISRATGARTSSKKKPALPLARAERKPLDQKKKPAPRHQRENLLKEKTSPALWPARSASHLTKRKNRPAPPAREPAQRKNQPYLWPARSAKPFDQKKKPAPRHRRENQLKEKTSSASGPRGAHSHLTERIKPAPRHRRENLLKENQSQL